MIILPPEGQPNKSKQPDVSAIMKDAPFPHRAEHDIYFIALQQVWEDGIITDDEKRMLEGLQSSLNISRDEHNFLESKIAKDETKQRLTTYRKILEQAWADGILTIDEQALLEKVRSKMQISDEEHNTIENEIKRHGTAERNVVLYPIILMILIVMDLEAQLLLSRLV